MIPDVEAEVGVLSEMEGEGGLGPKALVVEEPAISWLIFGDSQQ